VSQATPTSSQTPFPRLLLVGGGVMALGFVLPLLFHSSTQTSGTLSPEVSTVSATEGPSIFAIFGKMTLGIGFIAAMSIGLMRWLHREKTATLPKNLERLASLPIDLRTVVHLVRFEDRRLLIGMDANGIQTVTELPGKLPHIGTTVLGPLPISVPVAERLEVARR
jgi:flagellar biogenesis protein FliO